MSTTAEQLTAFAANPVVDRVRWEVVYQPSTSLSSRPDYKFEAIFGVIKIQISTFIVGDYLWWLDCQLLGFEDYELFCKKESWDKTPADACREALRIVRERVKELGKCVGLPVIEFDSIPMGAIETKSEAYAEAENNCYTNDLYGFQQGAKWMYYYLTENKASLQNPGDTLCNCGEPKSPTSEHFCKECEAAAGDLIK